MRWLYEEASTVYNGCPFSVMMLCPACSHNSFVIAKNVLCVFAAGTAIKPGRVLPAKNLIKIGDKRVN